MGDLAADRVYDDHTGDDTAFLATATGVARVAVAHARVGRFGLAERSPATDVAAIRPPTGGKPVAAAAADDDVLLGTGDDWRETGFGPAEAVGFDATDADDDPALIAVDREDHEVGRLLDPAAAPTDWLTVADVDAPVRAVDGPFLAAADGVYRLTPDGVEHVGLDGARDVAVATGEGDGAVVAATGDGLYRLDGAGDWTREREGSFRAVGASGGRAIAVGDGGAVVRASDGDGWTAVELPAEPVDVAVGMTAYGVTDDGTFLAREEGGWRTRSLGFPDVRRLCVVTAADDS